MLAHYYVTEHIGINSSQTSLSLAIRAVTLTVLTENLFISFLVSDRPQRFSSLTDHTKHTTYIHTVLFNMFIKPLMYLYSSNIRITFLIFLRLYLCPGLSNVLLSLPIHPSACGCLYATKQSLFLYFCMHNQVEQLCADLLS